MEVGEWQAEWDLRELGVHVGLCLLQLSRQWRFSLRLLVDAKMKVVLIDKADNLFDETAMFCFVRYPIRELET